MQTQNIMPECIKFLYKFRIEVETVSFRFLSMFSSPYPQTNSQNISNPQIKKESITERSNDFILNIRLWYN